MGQRLPPLSMDWARYVIEGQDKGTIGAAQARAAGLFFPGASRARV